MVSGSKAGAGVTKSPALLLVADRGEAPPSPPRRYTKARRIALDRDASLDEAVTAVFSVFLDHFAANAPGLAEAGDPEAVHQLRVALRRLRVFLGLLQRVAPSPQLVKASADAKTLASAFGAARDWRLLLERLEGEFPDPSQEPGAAELLAAVRRRVDETEESARGALGAPAARDLLRETRAILKSRVWRGFSPDLAQRRSARPFALRQLSRLHKGAASRCKQVERLAPLRRHEARIALKKLRYAAEFFETLFEEDRARDYIDRLATVQEWLGEDHDWTTAERLLSEIAEESKPVTRRAIRTLLAEGAKARRKILAGAGKSVKRLRKADRFWRL
jgi:triphosphatase